MDRRRAETFTRMCRGRIQYALQELDRIRTEVSDDPHFERAEKSLRNALREFERGEKVVAKDYGFTIKDSMQT